MLGGVIAASFGITAPYWAGFVVAVMLSATTWRVFKRATVAQAYAEPAPMALMAPEAPKAAEAPGAAISP
jgi:hypothetical protein